MIRTGLRWLLAAGFLVAAWFHLTAPDPFLRIMPSRVPLPEQVVFWTGVAEAAGAFALLQPFGPYLRKAGATGLALYALFVWPANINHMIVDLSSDDGGLGLAYHVPRMFAQPLIIWLALWTGEVIDWPFTRRHQSAGSASTNN